MDISVSPMFKKEDGAYAFVTFREGGKFVEFRIPECTRVSGAGFAKTEEEKFIQYMKDNREKILETAGRVNPLTALIGRRDS